MNEKDYSEYKMGLLGVVLISAAGLIAWPFTSWIVPVVMCGSQLIIILIGTIINILKKHKHPVKRTLHLMDKMTSFMGSF